ncbi:MAG: T9SS type A sorting domain-containing protein [Bacteroidales bacterium]|nr:T9SS type A sorting domain-containing protein [Bacteroidales bacterium]
MKKLLLTVSIIFFCVLYCNSQNVRFKERCMENISRTNEIHYGSGPRFSVGTAELYFDFYTPFMDTMPYRPLVIEMFGGAFIAGNKNWSDMVAIADTLAHYGYAVASIEYRLGYTPTHDGVIRAGYRATQDVNAAICYFKEKFEMFGIDTTQIFLLGNSAGTIAGLNSVFGKEDERPAATYNNGFASPDLGCLTCTSYYPNHSTEVAGMVAQWGAVLDLQTIDADETTPICLIHGLDDTTVPFEHGPPYDLSIMPVMYGSHDIALHMDSLGMDTYELYAFPGYPHAFYFEDGSTEILNLSKLDTCLRIAIEFLAKHNKYIQETHIDDPIDINSENYLANIEIYPNPAQNEINIRNIRANYTENLQISVVDINGKIISTDNLDSKTIDISYLSEGIYFIKIISNKFIKTIKFVKN